MENNRLFILLTDEFELLFNLLIVESKYDNKPVNKVICTKISSHKFIYTNNHSLDEPAN